MCSRHWRPAQRSNPSMGRSHFSLPRVSCFSKGTALAQVSLQPNAGFSRLRSEPELCSQTTADPTSLSGHLGKGIGCRGQTPLLLGMGKKQIVATALQAGEGMVQEELKFIRDLQTHAWQC